MPYEIIDIRKLCDRCRVYISNDLISYLGLNNENREVIFVENRNGEIIVDNIKNKEIYENKKIKIIESSIVDNVNRVVIRKGVRKRLGIKRNNFVAFIKYTKDSGSYIRICKVEFG